MWSLAIRAAAEELLASAAAFSFRGAAQARRRALGLAASAGLLASPLALAQSYTVSPVAYNWIPTAGHTILSSWDTTLGCVDATGDDSLSTSLPIGFTFRFGTTNYTQLRIMSNGRVQFANTRCTFGTNAVGPPRTYTDPMPATNLANTLRVYGADLDASTAGGGTITYATVGSAPNRIFVVSWNGVPQWGTNRTTSYNLQIQLYESGEFWYMYGASADNYPGTTPVGPAQLGWELSATDYYAQSGLPAASTGLRFRPTASPSLTVTKTSSVVSDPVNGTTQAKRVPGSVLRYTITVTNTGAGTVDASTLSVADPVPANTDLYVGPSPVTFVNGSPASGLSFTSANVSYSNQPGGGAPYSYTPVPNAAGYDPAVTGLRIAPTGVMAGAGGAGQPSFSVSFQVRVR